MNVIETWVSICIPTFNRARFLPELLDSVAAEISRVVSPERSVEVCVSDNASTDATGLVLDAWIAAHPQVRVTRRTLPENLGPDHNYLAVAELATGRYIWFMGSDDTVPPGALDHVFGVLEFGPDLVLGARTNCTFDMQPRYHCGWFEPDTRHHFDLRQSDQLRAYLSRATSLGAQFSYLSSVIVRRTAWEQVDTDLTYVGSAYIHVQKCVDIIRRGATLIYIPDSIVNNRGDNDHFATAGAVHRVMIDLRGYVRLSERFEDPAIRSMFLNALRRERPLVHTAFFLRKNGTNDQWQEASALLQRCGAPGRLIQVLTFAPGLVRLIDRPLVQRLARRLLGRRLPRQG